MASISSRVTYGRTLVSVRFNGMASTRVAIQTLAGSRRATMRKNEWMAVRRRLREATESRSRTRVERRCGVLSRRTRIISSCVLPSNAGLPVNSS
jgi:hypothetical protein